MELLQRYATLYDFLCTHGVYLANDEVVEDRLITFTKVRCIEYEHTYFHLGDLIDHLPLIWDLADIECCNERQLDDPDVVYLSEWSIEGEED